MGEEVTKGGYCRAHKVAAILVLSFCVYAFETCLPCSDSVYNLDRSVYNPLSRAGGGIKAIETSEQKNTDNRRKMGGNCSVETLLVLLEGPPSVHVGTAGTSNDCIQDQ